MPPRALPWWCARPPRSRRTQSARRRRFPFRRKYSTPAGSTHTIAYPPPPHTHSHSRTIPHPSSPPRPPPPNTHSCWRRSARPSAAARPAAPRRWRRRCSSGASAPACSGRQPPALAPRASCSCATSSWLCACRGAPSRSSWSRPSGTSLPSRRRPRATRRSWRSCPRCW